MRILIVHDYGVPIGGAEVVIMEQKMALEGRGHQVKVLASTPRGTRGAFNEYSFESRDTRAWQKLVTHLHNPAAARAVRAAIQDFHPDIVHFNTITKASPAVLKATDGVPTVVSLHDYGLFYPRLKRVLPVGDFCGIGDGACCVKHAGLMRYYFEWARTTAHLNMKKHVNAYIAPSNYVAGIGKKLGLSQMRIVPNGVTLPKITDSPGSGLLYVGRLEPEKGVSKLINALALVVQDVPSTKLVIAGDGSQRANLEEQAKKLGLAGNVHFTGHKSLAEVRRLYADAQIVIVPSLWQEPFGLIGPEAMGAGRPVIAPNRGGISDWLKDGVNGLAVNPDNLEDLAAAISSLLTDHVLFGKLAAGALKSSEFYSIGQHSLRLELLYQELIQAQPKLYPARKTAA